MAEANKDTIYIDIDDEITAIIDKVRGSSSKVVALVLPKRATTLQSIVNMKLLKRAADQNKQNLVLVTTESGLLPLAGAVGLHVAKTPNSRPEIPVAPRINDGSEEQVDESVDLLGEDEAGPLAIDEAGNKSVGELAGATMPLPSRPAPDSGIETVELDNEDKAAVAAAPFAAKAAKPKKDSKLKIPDFDKFRLLLILGGALLLLLIVGGYFALVVMPKATIAIATNASNVNTNVDFTLSTTATTANTSKKIIPAKQVSTQKTYTGTANATGQLNNGDKATGSVNITAGSCGPNFPASLPSGSGISSGGKTYITQAATVFTTGQQGNKCIFKSSQATPIKAQNGGANYDVDSGTSFTVSGRSDLSASGSADGGSDDIQQIVSQADIDSAKGKITTDDNSLQNDLASQLKGQGLYAINATYVAGTPSYTNSTNAGSTASSVTVTETVTYTMLGANEDNIKALVDNNIKSQIDTSKQGILSEGITQGSFKLSNTTATGAAMNLQTTAEVGPSINTATIASEAAGKKSGDIKSNIKSNPDVTDVEVKLSPFWVTKAPKNVNKITVMVAKPTKTANAQ